MSLPVPPPPINPNVQISPAHSPVQSSNARKRLKIETHHMHDKGKVVAAPSSPSSDSAKSVSSRIHLRDDCSHVIMRSSPKAPHNLRLIQKIQKDIATTKGKLSPKVENTFFEYIFLLRTMNC
jgi:hypothetical protein